jgi:hypothetical protein
LGCRRRRHRGADDEVDLANVLERQLQEPRTVSVILGRSNLELKVAFLWIEKCQELRIGQKDIYVMALR